MKLTILALAFYLQTLPPLLTWIQDHEPLPVPEQAVQTPPPEMPDVPDTRGSVPMPPSDAAPMPEPNMPRRPPWIMPGYAGVPDDYPTSFYGISQWGWGIGGQVPVICDGWRLASWGSGGAVALTDYAGTKGAQLYWTNMLLHGQPAQPGGENMVRWGVLGFDIKDWHFYRLSTVDIPKEHGIYGTIVGGPLEWNECEFDECWGQAIQLVYAHPLNPFRKFQTALTPERWYRMANSLQDKEIVVRRCVILQSSIYTKSERASYPISLFEALNDAGPWYGRLIVEGCYMKTDWPWTDPNGFQRTACGGIMGHAAKHATIKNNYMEYRLGDRDVIQLWSCSDGVPGTEDVVIDGNMILASQNVDIRLRTPQDTIRIRRNRGTCNVVVSTNPWYVWGNNGWDESKVIYRGPISSNWSLN